MLNYGSTRYLHAGMTLSPWEVWMHVQCTVHTSNTVPPRVIVCVDDYSGSLLVRQIKFQLHERTWGFLAVNIWCFLQHCQCVPR